MRLFPILFSFVALVLCGCAKPSITMNVPTDLKDIYRDDIEISFCLKDSGQIYNVTHGGKMTVELPLCAVDDIVCHSHTSASGDAVATGTDLVAFREYCEHFGNTRYGLLLHNEFQVYEVEPRGWE